MKWNTKKELAKLVAKSNGKVRIAKLRNRKHRKQAKEFFESINYMLIEDGKTHLVYVPDGHNKVNVSTPNE